MSAIDLPRLAKPRRSQLLDQLGVRHTLLLPNVEGDARRMPKAIGAALPGEALPTTSSA